MAIFDRGITLKHVLGYGRLFLLALAMFLGWVFYDYFFGLTVQAAHVLTITKDATRPDMREIRFFVQSNYSESWFVSPGLRRFFRRQPQVCFQYPDGSELVNDDVKSPCMLEDDEFEKKNKSHRQEISTFTLPIFLQPGPLNQKKLFLSSLRKQQGVWLKFSLGGHIIPPAVTTSPIFLDLRPYCIRHAEACRGLLIAEK